ncbi:hypothetical protein V6M85_01230 [Sulfolobus tengchongensis]|uniref:Uncharacterized protein n=1 Tax=Sulfolobus tengchongensis TaxID=207809 RepID=A0AAX4L138_9CREN
MKLNGIDISSLITTQTNYIITKYEFIESLADEFPAYLSLDINNNILRELIIFSVPRFSFNFYPNYKYTIRIEKNNETLYSLKGSEKILIALKAFKKSFKDLNVLMARLYFLGLKDDKPYRMLIFNDIPVIASNRNDLINQLIEYLKEIYNITVTNLPTVIDGVEYKEKSSAKILDVDYAITLP